MHSGSRDHSEQQVTLALKWNISRPNAQHWYFSCSTVETILPGLKDLYSVTGRTLDIVTTWICRLTDGSHPVLPLNSPLCRIKCIWWQNKHFKGRETVPKGGSRWIKKLSSSSLLQQPCLSHILQSRKQGLHRMQAGSFEQTFKTVIPYPHCKLTHQGVRGALAKLLTWVLGSSDKQASTGCKQEAETPLHPQTSKALTTISCLLRPQLC